MSKDYYKILEVDRNATQEEIKAEYRKLCKIHHPDKGGDEEKFKEISDAYSILSDEEKKDQYDRYGSVDGSRNQGFGGGFDDIFSQFSDIFGGGSRRRQSNNPQQRKGSDLRVKVSVTLHDMIFGSSKKIKYTRHTKCQPCDGKGGSDLTTCLPCQGAGHRVYVQNTPIGTIRQSSVCSHCSGSGKSIKNPCKSCSGQGTTVNQETVDIEIPKGASNGNFFSMPQYGNFTRGGIAGDLQIVIDEIPDKDFVRDELNLIYDDKISLIDAILGTEKKLMTPHGTEIKYNIQPGSTHGKLLRIVGKGVPDVHYGGMGDLIIRLNIKMPSSISKEEKDLLEQLKKSPNFN